MQREAASRAGNAPRFVAGDDGVWEHPARPKASIALDLARLSPRRTEDRRAKTILGVFAYGPLIVVGACAVTAVIATCAVVAEVEASFLHWR